jgi:hypothetical protein
VINQLLNQYALEGIDMPYTMEQFRKEYIKAHLMDLDPEEVLSRYDPEDRLKGLDPEDRLKGLDPEDRLKGLDPEDRLKGLDPEAIERYLNKLKNQRH